MEKNPYIRSFSRYQQLARRTQNPALTDRERILHAALGLCAEVEELRDEMSKVMSGFLVQETEVAKETGDVMWMLAELCDAIHADMDVVLCRENLQMAESIRKNGSHEYAGPKPVTKWKNIDDIGQLAGCVAGCVQKTFQGHPVNEAKIAYVIPAIVVRLVNLAPQYSFTLYQAMYQNIEKLKARYPDGFSADKSIHRKEYDNE